MTITDDRSSTPAPAAAPPSYVRRHPILAAFGVLSGLSLLSALWPVSAIVIAVAVAGHATGLDRAAVLLAERLAARISSSAHHHGHAEPGPTAPAGGAGTVHSCALSSCALSSCTLSPRPFSASTPGARSCCPGSAIPPRSSRPCAHSASSRPKSPSQNRRAPRGVEHRRRRSLIRRASQPSRARASRSRCSDLSLPRNAIASITGSPAGAPRMAT